MSGVTSQYQVHNGRLRVGKLVCLHVLISKAPDIC